MPGETTGCTGCHEKREQAFQAPAPLAALNRPPSRIEAVSGVPDVFDFPRDIQPILDRHCLKCHDYDKRSGGVILSGDRGPMYSHSYYSLIARNQIADGRNRPQSNYPPRALGAGASRLMQKIDGSHNDVKVSEHERKRIRYWIESGAPYPGTYAAVGCGMFGGYVENALQVVGDDWPSVVAAKEVVGRRCGRCHQGTMSLPYSPAQHSGLSRYIVYNLTRPEKSLMLLAPLAAAAGGYGICEAGGENRRSSGTGARPFDDTDDPDYQKLLAAIQEAKQWLDGTKRFDMPGFRPNEPYVREMKKYGILPPSIGPSDPVDPYATDRAYWQSLWYRPPTP